MDEMTWRQWINNALKRSHGIYGEGIEYYILNRDEKIIYLKVNYTDATLFSSALATYTSSDELLGFPLVVNIIQETPYLKELKTNDDDKLWFNNELNEIDDE
ncbi:ribonuclease P KNAG_0G01450 [Huiozyma naganishii CBS 8797]|uniref:Ribonucleases P/MRP subunit Pop8-like domain-containing protein n=1 Tax=Huiozyma naganishii (strain ATCC MYA-139 / BCRC 22969 / CBS 8797 / KCTC 17520 / NBRC 10181 / NCYC 3082 / Yp74L-3) TaxID=1071383 RepID=J7RNQ2_HUIN7|nr:hypothetical protein KNAG_0G01450 [Kazachstania naganishii CBS 8797]CCK71203.1 hypothetical protein KNAG_0G01450 [Kazachstania naganishii CBS 8797]